MPSNVFTTDGALLEVYTIGIDLKIIVKGQKNFKFSSQKNCSLENLRWMSSANSFKYQVLR